MNTKATHTLRKSNFDDVKPLLMHFNVILIGFALSRVEFSFNREKGLRIPNRGYDRGHGIDMNFRLRSGLQQLRGWLGLAP